MNTKQIALMCAAQSLAGTSHCTEDVTLRADTFYEWLTQSDTPMHTVDPEMPYGKDMVSKAQLKEKLFALGLRRHTGFPPTGECIGYSQAIYDTIKLINEM